MLILGERYRQNPSQTSSCSVRKPVLLEWPQQTKQGLLPNQQQIKQEKVR